MRIEIEVIGYGIWLGPSCQRAVDSSLDCNGHWCGATGTF